MRKYLHLNTKIRQPLTPVQAEFMLDLDYAVHTSVFETHRYGINQQVTKRRDKVIQQILSYLVKIECTSLINFERI